MERSGRSCPSAGGAPRPRQLRCTLAFDRTLCTDVLEAFITALTRSLMTRAKRLFGSRRVQHALAGARTVIQRGESALPIDPHLNTLALGGV